MEQDLEMYSRAQEELNLMLEEKLEEPLRAETLERLEFCESNIESLNMELQQLRAQPRPMEERSETCVFKHPEYV